MMPGPKEGDPGGRFAMRRWLAVVVTVTVALGVSGVGASAAPQPWNAEIVDPDGLDAPEGGYMGNAPVIVYAANTASGSEIRFAYRSDAWHTELIDDNAIFWIGASTQLAVDALGTPWAFYTRQGFDDAVLRYRGGRDLWVQALAIPDADPMDMAIDANGDIALVYVASDGSLTYGVWNGSTLSETTVAPAAEYASLGTESAPAIAFVDGDFHLAYAELVGSQWTVTPVGEPDHAGSPSLAFDNSAHPIIAYQAPGDGFRHDFRIATRGGSGTWQRRIVEGGMTGLNPSMITTSRGVFAAFEQTSGTASNLQLWKWTPSGSGKGTIFTDVCTPCEGTSLVNDPRGAPHVAFVDNDMGLEWGSPPSP
jgi:hypothetical protein